MPESLISLATLTRRADFVHAAAAGQRWAAGCVLVQAAIPQHPHAHIRIGFTATRKLGNAVVRNRAKRRLRAAARQLLPALGHPGTDYVLIARNAIVQTDFDTLCNDLRYALKKVHGKRPVPDAAPAS